MQHLPQMTFEEKACYFGAQLFTTIGNFRCRFFRVDFDGRTRPGRMAAGAQGFGDQFGTRYTQGMVKSTGTFLVGALIRGPQAKAALRPGLSRSRTYPHTQFWPRLGSFAAPRRMDSQ